MRLGRPLSVEGRGGTAVRVRRNALVRRARGLWVPLVLILASAWFSGCFGGGPTIEGTVDVPFPRGGAWALYREDGGAHEGEEILYRVLGMADVPFVDGNIYNAILIQTEVDRECEDGSEVVVSSVDEFDPVHRAMRSDSWLRWDCDEDSDGLLPDGVELELQPRIEVKDRFVDFNAFRLSIPINHVTGKTLSSDTASMSVAFTSVVRETGMEDLEVEDRVQTTQKLRYHTQEMKDGKATMEVRRVGGDPSLLEFHHGVPFPVRIEETEVAFPQRMTVRTLLDWGQGDVPLDWTSGAPATASMPDPLPTTRSKGLLPPLGPVPFRYPLDEALSAVLDDPLLVHFHAWRESNPEAGLTNAWLRTYEDALGRTGAEWSLWFGGWYLVSSVRIEEPAEFASVSNSDSTFNLVDPVDPHPNRIEVDHNNSVVLAEVLEGVRERYPEVVIDWAMWSIDGPWCVAWLAEQDDDHDEGHDDDGLSRYEGMKIDPGSGLVYQLQTIKWGAQSHPHRTRDVFPDYFCPESGLI